MSDKKKFMHSNSTTKWNVIKFLLAVAIGSPLTSTFVSIIYNMITLEIRFFTKAKNKMKKSNFTVTSFRRQSLGLSAFFPTHFFSIEGWFCFMIFFSSSFFVTPMLTFILFCSHFFAMCTPFVHLNFFSFCLRITFM